MKYLIYLLVFTAISLVSCFEEQEFSVTDEVNYLAFVPVEATALEGTDTEVTVEIIYAGGALSSAIPLTISLETTATEGVDYTLSEALSTLSIPAGEFSTTLTITILDNDLSFGPRSLILSLTEVGDFKVGYLGAEAGSTFSLQIVEDDATTFGYTSFEEPTAGLVNNYPSQDGVEQVNVPGENSVDFVSTGGEMGFNSSYVAGEEGGADSGLLFGVSKFTSDTEWEYDLGSFTDGSQAYSTSDADGLMEIVFDELTIPESTNLLQVSVDLWFSVSTWEEDDEFDFIWRSADGDELILSLRSDGVAMTDSPDGTGNVIVDKWTSFVADISDIKSGRLVIQIGTDSGSEIAFIDNISITGF